MVAAVAALLGALIGGMFPYLASRGQWRREDRLRFLEDRRDAYAELAALACDLERHSAGPDLDELKSALWRALETVVLLAPLEVGEAGRGLVGAAFDLAHNQRRERQDTLRQVRLQALRRFEEAARRDLGVAD